jgi:hypothetical protein
MATGARKRRRQRATQLCVSCTTERYPIVARGLCKRCYPLTRRIEALERGDLKPLGILAAMRRPDHPETQRLRMGFIRQYRSRLTFLRSREEERRGLHLDALTIEHLLRDLGKRAGACGDPHYNVASWIIHDFPAPSRLALFQLLHEIEERIPWQPNVYRALTE